MEAQKLIETINENLFPNLDDINEISEKAFDLIDIFVERYFELDFCEILINNTPINSDLRKTARILDILVWSTPDNGKKLDELIENWLISKNLNKIKTILLRKDWEPNVSWNIENLINIVPELKEIIDYYSKGIENNEIKNNILIKLKNIKKAGNNQYKQ